VRIALDNGKIKDYPTWWTEYGTEGCYPDKPHHTKCGLSFKKDPKENACEHLDCAIDSAKHEATIPLMIYSSLYIMLIIAGWYEKGDLLLAIRGSDGFFIFFGLFFLIMSISPFRRWRELNEYKNFGTIHGRSARRLWVE